MNTKQYEQSRLDVDTSPAQAKATIEADAGTPEVKKARKRGKAKAR